MQGGVKPGYFGADLFSRLDECFAKGDLGQRHRRRAGGLQKLSF